MRRVLACSRCRNHKIKCVHNGEPPCTYCIHRNVAQDCELSYPENKKSKKSGETHRVVKPDSSAKSSVPLVPMDAIFTPGVRPQIEPQFCVPPVDENTPLVATTRGTIFDLVPHVPAQVIRDAVVRVVRAFPELSVYHLPTAVKSVEKLHPILVGATLAHAGFFNPYRDADNCSSNDQWLGVSSYQVTHHVYEKLTMDAIFKDHHFLLEPNLDIACAALILCVVKWGKNEYYASWMLHSCATRIIQSLNFDESFLARCKVYPLLKIMKTRAYWCAFALDKIICSGPNKCFLVVGNEDVPLPIGDEDFSFLTLRVGNEGHFPPKQEEKLTIRNFLEQAHLNPIIPRKCIFATFCFLWSIWGKINQRNMMPDRKNYVLECPWDPSTEIYKIRQQLLDFCKIYPKDWKWDKSKYLKRETPAIRDNLVLIMNCVYHLSIIFINRDFLPFLPYDIDRPVGPLGAQSPPSSDSDYWIQSARRCFRSTRILSEILDTLMTEEKARPPRTEPKSSIMVTPFYSFVAFTCCILACYGSHFYWMDPDSEKYNDDFRNPARLRNCYHTSLDLLKAKEGETEISKKWLAVVLKLDEINKYVAQNRCTAKANDWGKKCFKNIGRSLNEPSLDAKHIEKLFPLLPLPHSQAQQNMESKYPSPAADSYFAQVGLLPQRGSNASSTFYGRLPPQTAPQFNPQFKMPPMVAYPAPFETTMGPPNSHSPGSPFPLLPPASACAPLASSVGSHQSEPLLASNTVPPIPTGSASAPVVNQITPNIINPKERPPQAHDDLSVEVDTDKINLFFNDNELDMLLQFKA